MPLYSGERARSFFRHHNRQLLNRIIAEEVGYYKLSLSETRSNIYGESKTKMYFAPVLLTCLYEVQDQISEDAEFGKNRAQLVDFKFLRNDLLVLNLVPEMGDIIMWQESYYEVDLLVENQRTMGKNPEYELTPQTDNIYGESWSMICKTHLTGVNRLNIIQTT